MIVHLCFFISINSIKKVMREKRVDLEGEVWKVIDGFGGNYEVSSLGRVWSVKRGKVLKTFNLSGYEVISLSVKGKCMTKAVHRLVLETFSPSQDPIKCEVRHLNGDMLDNRVENLAWGSVKDRVADRSRIDKMIETKIRTGKYSAMRVGLPAKEQMRLWKEEHRDRFLEYQRRYNQKRSGKPVEQPSIKDGESKMLAPEPVEQPSKPRKGDWMLEYIKKHIRKEE